MPERDSRVDRAAHDSNSCSENETCEKKESDYAQIHQSLKPGIVGIRILALSRSESESKAVSTVVAKAYNRRSLPRRLAFRPLYGPAVERRIGRDGLASVEKAFESRTCEHNRAQCDQHE